MIVERFERRTFRIGKKNANERILKLKAKKEAEGWNLVDVDPTKVRQAVLVIFEKAIKGSRVKRRTPKGWQA